MDISKEELLLSFKENFPDWFTNVENVSKTGENEIMITFNDSTPRFRYGFKGENEMYLKRVTYKEEDYLYECSRH